MKSLETSISNETRLANSFNVEEHDAGHFSSRFAFWLSAIGCAVGFGNVWRFPFLCFANGGLAFVIPYVIMLVFITVPISLIEFGLGQIAQGSHIKAFAILRKRFGAVGICNFTCFNISNYYLLLLAWSMIYAINSFKADLPWALTQSEIDACKSADSASCDQIINCSWNTVTDACSGNPYSKAGDFMMSALSFQEDYTLPIEKWSPFLFIAMFFTWLVVLGFSIGGAKILGYANYFTTGAPSILICILLVVGLKLPGSGIGVKAYIGKLEVDKLVSGTTWTKALNQAIFSMGAAQGTMAAYTAHNQKNQNFVEDVAVVAGGDLVFAFIAGLAVFSVMGFVSQETGVPLKDMPSTRGLTFLSYPIGIASGLNQPWSNMFSFLFFFSLWSLGVSTVLGYVEAVCLGLSQCRLFTTQTRIGRKTLWITNAAIGVVFCLLYASDHGIYLLDTLDEYNSNVTLVFTMVFETLVISWLCPWELWVDKCGFSAVIIHLLTWWIGLFIGFIFISIQFAGHLIIGLVFQVLIVSGGFAAAIYLSKGTTSSMGEIETKWQRAKNLMFYNTDLVRKVLNKNTGSGGLKIPAAWNFFIKYMVSYVSLFFLMISLTNKYKTYGYPDPKDGCCGTMLPWVFVVATTGPNLVILAMIVGIIFPNVVDWLMPEDKNIEALNFEVDPLEKA